MTFDRQAYPQLQAWKESPTRKPLILRGARQVGKTTLVRQFSTTYRQRILLNLELEAHRRFFTSYPDVRTLTDALFITHELSSSDRAQTLLFIDEIQESPEAVAMLRYFHEWEPELHVIAAGSLLEHVMRGIRSFPVGRVEMLYLHPMNFPEFMQALARAHALAEFRTVPIREAAHTALLDLFHRYAVIGGMPEIVAGYERMQQVAGLQSVYNGLWETYRDDVRKYASNRTEENVIRHIMSTAHLYADTRVKFQHFGQSNYRSREVGEAFRKLDDAGIIRLIHPTTDLAPPLQPDLRKSPRLQFLDTGFLNHSLGIQAEMLALTDLNDAFRGAVIPHLVTQELISTHFAKPDRPVFWVREKPQSSAEVDLLVTHNGLAIPIEVKSGKEGKLKSLHQYVQASSHPYAVRMYAGRFQIEQHHTRDGKKYYLMNLPYYLGTRIHEYLEYFLQRFH